MGRTFTEKMLSAACVALLTVLLWCGIIIPVTAKVNTAHSNHLAIDQVITFNQLPDKIYGDLFSPGATANSGLPVTYISSDLTIAKVVNGNTIQIVGVGTVTITAEQPGNDVYNRAPRVSRTLIVNKADVTITAISQTRAYGSKNATLTVAYTGLKNNETTISTKPTITTTAIASSNVGVYDIIVTGGASNNYNITRVNGTITVTPASLIIKAANKTKLYGAANPALTVTYSGFKNGDNSAKLLTQPVITTTAQRNSQPGTYPITVTGASINNYSISYVDGVLTVGKGVLTVRVTNQTKTYGANVPALTYTITGFAEGQTAASLTSPVVISTTATQNSPVDKYPITVSGAAAADYDIRYVQGTLTVSKARLTIRANSITRVYGAENPELTLTYTGFVLGETSAVLTQQPIVSTDAVAASPAGSYNIIVSGAAADNYNISYGTGKLTITKAPLNIKANDLSRPYGTTNPQLTFTYTGFINGDDERVLTKQPVAATTAQVRSAVGVYRVTPSAATAANYSITYSAGTLTIEKVLLTVKANDITRLYGATSPAFSVSYIGLVNGETATAISKKPTFTSSATVTSPVGTYTITPSAASATNYDLVYETGTLTISKRTLTITAVNKTRSYGRANPTLNFTTSGLVNGDRTADVINGTLQLSTTATPASEPGNYPIELNEVTADNYDVVTVNGILTVTNAVLTITPSNASKTYGQPNPQFRYTISGYVNDDDASIFTRLPQTPATTATAQSPAGTYGITTSGALVNGFYDLRYVVGTLTINKAPLRVTAANATRIYGQENPVFASDITGYVNGDTRATAIVQEPVGTTPALQNSPVGDYAIQPTGGASANYSFTYVAGKLTVTPAALLIKANDVSRDFGQPNPVFTATYTGLASFDTPASLTKGPDFSTTATVNSVPGTYSITPGGAISSNYTITYAGGTLTINKPKLIISANNQSRNYGAANPVLTLTYSGFLNGDTEAIFTTLPTVTTTAVVSSNAGSYDIIPSGGSAPAYDLVYTKGTLTVNKVPLTVTANNATRFYGVGNPALGITYTGFVNNDTEASLATKPTVATTATPTSPLGTYVLVPGGGGSPNYNFTYVNGTLTITPGVATITFAVPASKTYGNIDFDPGATSNVVNEPIIYTSANPLVATIVNNKVHITGSGNTQITASFAANSNYSQTVPVSQTLVVNKAPLNVKADNKDKTYGSANPALTIIYTGFVNGETQAVLTMQATAVTSATVNSAAGNYSITPSGGSAANYDLTYTSGILTINRAQLTVTAQNATRAFGVANPVFGVNYSGFVNGDTEAALSVQPTVSTTATATSRIGTYALVPAGGLAANYNFVYVNGTLTITGGAATISFAPLPEKTFGDADFDAGATNNVGETIEYSSSNINVATVINGKIHITGAGTAIITASFPVGSGYNLTQPQTQLLIVNKAQQIITFATIPLLSRGDVYALQNVTSSSGLSVSFTVADQNIAFVQEQTLTAKQIGSTTITASQAGNNNYLPATAVTRALEVKNMEGKVEIEVHRAMSPNGDGINDVFFIEGITKFPQNKVLVYNRNGVKVFEIDGYDNASRSFNGRSNINGQLQQPGTYVYVIEFTADGKGRHVDGAFVLKY